MSRLVRGIFTMFFPDPESTEDACTAQGTGDHSSDPTIFATQRTYTGSDSEDSTDECRPDDDGPPSYHHPYVPRRPLTPILEEPGDFAVDRPPSVLHFDAPEWDSSKSYWFSSFFDCTDAASLKSAPTRLQNLLELDRYDGSQSGISDFQLSPEASSMSLCRIQEGELVKILSDLTKFTYAKRDLKNLRNNRVFDTKSFTVSSRTI